MVSNAVCNAVSNTVVNAVCTNVQNQNQNQSSSYGLWVVVRGHFCIASNGDLRAPSCNAEAIEHLDFAPTCEEGSETSDPCGNPDELTDYDTVECYECGHTWPSGPASIKRIEPLR